MTPEEKAAKKARAWLLDPEQASELLGISRSSIVRMIADGQIPAICLRSGRRKRVWRIRREILERWVINKEKEQKRAPSAGPISEPAAGDIKALNGRTLD